MSREDFEGGEEAYLRQEFAQHPHANRLRKEWAARLESARMDRDSAARSSADPAVRALQAHVDTMKELLAHLEGGKLD